MNFIPKTPPKVQNVSTVVAVSPIIARHWPDKDLEKFARAAAASELGKHWVAPPNRNFVDRPPGYVGDLPAQPHALSYLLREVG